MLKHSVLPVVLTIILGMSALAQSSSDIVNVIRSSKLVDTKRELTATLNGYEATISTFCDSRAADKDCKITALLILKELTQHYKAIRQARVSFYDEHRTNHYRTVVVQERMVQLVDSGTPIANVLSTVPIASGEIPTTQTFSLKSLRPGPYYAQRQELAGAIQQIIDKGGRPDSCVAAFARLEQACAAPSPNRTYISQLYNSIVASVNNENHHLAQSKRSNDRKPNIDEITNAVKQGINSSDSGDLDGVLRNIESKIRSAGVGH